MSQTSTTQPGTANERRLRVMISMRITWHLRDMCESGVLNRMAEEFDLSFLCAPNAGHVEYELERYGPIYFMPETGRAGSSLLGRLRDWRRQDLNNVGYALLQVAARKDQENFEYLVNRTTSHWWSLTRNLVYLTAYSGFASIAGRLIRRWLRVTAAPVIPEDARPDVLFVMAIPWSINGHTDDVIRHARKIGIPIFGQHVNWDNISDRHFFEPLDALAVFGEQSFILAKTLHGIPTHRLFVTGSPRFEMLHQPAPDKAVARERLGLPDKGRILLYCMPARGFAHFPVLKTLNDAIASGRLPKDTHILLKPHPGKPQVDPLGNDGPSAAELVKELPHVSVFIEGTEPSPTPLKLFPYLYAAADAVVSNYSTMVLEGLIVGLPSLCLAYNDPEHPSNEFDFDWEKASYRMHLYPMRHSDAVVVCENRADIESAARELIALIDAPETIDVAKRTAEIAVIGGPRTCGARIVEAVRTFARQGSSDGSEVLAPTGGFWARLKELRNHKHLTDRTAHNVEGSRRG